MPTAPVGLAHILFHRSTWSNGWYCYLEDLFVDPARRQKGTGRALIEAVYARGRRPRLHPHLLDDPGDQRPRPRALRSGGDQIAVRAVWRLVGFRVGGLRCRHRPSAFGSR